MDSEKIIIRVANKNDAEVIADISRETFYDSFASYNTEENMNKFMNRQFTKEKLMAEVDTPGNIFLMAYINNELAGYVRMTENDNPKELGNADAMEIVRIYSVQKKIGKGVGKALMQYCIDIAKQKEKKLIWLGVWEHNKRAIAFYTKWGFEKFSEHIFLLGDEQQTDWMMKKML